MNPFGALSGLTTLVTIGIMLSSSCQRPRPNKEAKSVSARSADVPKPGNVKGTPQMPHPEKTGNGFRYLRGNDGVVTGKQWLDASYFVSPGFAVVNDGKKWLVVDKDESMIGAAYIFDNYPDPVQEGFIRIREGKKVRYFSLDKKRFLKGAWDGGSPFNAGIACVCNDCIKKVREYSEISGGVGWVINTDGDVVQNLGEILGTFPKKCPIQPRKDSKEWEVYSEKRERERSESGHAGNKKPML